jgi:hypothetical protein
MNKATPKQRLVTMREAAGHVFPFIVPGTLLKWIMAGIFRPIIHSRGSVGPGKGSKLNFWDLVTVGVIHSFLASGLRFEHLQLHRRFNPAQVRFKRPPPHKGWQIIDTLEGRPIQEYLEGWSSEVIVVMEFERSDTGTNTVTLIRFGPEIEADSYWRESGDRFPVPSERTIFIHCRFWDHFVRNRLQQLP